MAAISRMLCLLFISLFGGAHSAHFAYIPNGQSYPCIMMDAKFSIRIDAIKYNRAKESFLINSEDEIINVTGSCGSTSTTSILNLAFGGRVTWSFIFRLSGNVVTLDRLVQFIPKRLFDAVTKLAYPVTFDDPNTIDLSLKNESYVCNIKQSRKYFPIKKIPGDISFRIMAKINRIKVQAFGMKNGKYSPFVLCHDEVKNLTTVSTTTPTTTTPPTTEVVPTTAPENLYYVTDSKNNTCIVLDGRIEIDIRYKYNTTNGVIRSRKLSFAIPGNATFSGNCKLSKVTQNLVIDFFEPSWSLEFIFQKKKNVSRPWLLMDRKKHGLDYRIDKINLVYVNNHERFPGSILPDGQPVSENSTNYDDYWFPHKPPGKDYYSCSANNDLILNKNTKLNTSDFKFKAFNTNKNRGFPGKSSHCTADDNDKEKHVVIIVASVIGAIFVIVIIIVILSVMCKKRRRRRHYKPLRGV